MENSSDSQSRQQWGLVTGASWIRRRGNERLVVVGKSRFGDSSPALLEIFSCDSNSTSLSGPPLATHMFEEGDPVSLAVHPNGDDIVCSLSTGDCKLFELCGLEASTELLIKELSLRGVGPQKCLAFSAQGSRFATGGLDGHLRIFEWPSLHILLDEPRAHTQVQDLDFSLDSKFLASTSTDGSALIWKTNDGVLLTSLTHDLDEKIECCRFSRDAAKPLLCCTILKGEEAATAVWDTNTWNRIGGKRILRKPESVVSIKLNEKHLQV